MNYKISFQEMDRLGAEKLSKQPLMTLEEKKKQVQDVKNWSKASIKKMR